MEAIGAVRALKRWVLNHPELKRFLVRAGVVHHYRRWKNGRLYHIDYEELVRTGELPLPKAAKFEPTMRCNLRCVMCHQNDRRVIEKGEMDIDDVRRIIDRLREAGVQAMHVLGGEIFLRKDLFEMFDYLEHQEMFFDLVTNGTLIGEDEARRLKDYRYLTAVDFSSDGLEEVNDAIRSRGVFNKVVSAIQLMRDERPFAITVTCVLNERTAPQFEEFINFFAAEGVDAITFILEMFNTREEISNSLGFVPDRSERDEFFLNVRSSEGTLDPNLLEHLIEVAGIKTQQTGVVVRVIPSVAHAEPEMFLNGHLRQDGRALMCGALSKVIIDQYGNVKGCPFINEHFGNLLEVSLEEIWNSESLKAYRKRLLASNLLDICVRCCNLEMAEAKVPA